MVLTIKEGHSDTTNASIVQIAPPETIDFLRKRLSVLRTTMQHGLILAKAARIPSIALKNIDYDKSKHGKSKTTALKNITYNKTKHRKSKTTNFLKTVDLVLCFLSENPQEFIDIKTPTGVAIKLYENFRSRLLGKKPKFLEMLNIEDITIADENKDLTLSMVDNIISWLKENEKVLGNMNFSTEIPRIKTFEDWQKEEKSSESDSSLKMDKIEETSSSQSNRDDASTETQVKRFAKN